jgi:ribosomal protein S18 acetylase RimI-like enzyme
VLEDATAVLAVLVARDVADLGVPDFTLEDLRHEWQAVDLDLSADARVVVEDGEIVGYAIVRRRGVMAAVAPDREGRGIGTRLLRWAEQRERERRSPRHRQWAVPGSSSQRLLNAAGYQPVRGYWRMSRRLDGSVQAIGAPSGVNLRPLELDCDAATICALHAASFAANADFHPTTVEQFCDEHLYVHDLDVELSCAAEHELEMVGFLLARRWRAEGVGFVDLLAVVPNQRRRGIATAMLSRAFVGFADAGLAEAQLGVASDNPRALGLYERVGMKARFRIETHERPVEVALPADMRRRQI